MRKSGFLFFSPPLTTRKGGGFLRILLSPSSESWPAEHRERERERQRERETERERERERERRLYYTEPKHWRYYPSAHLGGGRKRNRFPLVHSLSPDEGRKKFVNVVFMNGRTPRGVGWIDRGLEIRPMYGIRWIETVLPKRAWCAVFSKEDIIYWSLFESARRGII